MEQEKPRYKLRLKDILNPVGFLPYYNRTENLETLDETQRALKRLIGLYL